MDAGGVGNNLQTDVNALRFYGESLEARLELRAAECDKAEVLAEEMQQEAQEALERLSSVEAERDCLVVGLQEEHRLASRMQDELSEEKRCATSARAQAHAGLERELRQARFELAGMQAQLERTRAQRGSVAKFQELKECYTFATSKEEELRRSLGKERHRRSRLQAELDASHAEHDEVLELLGLDHASMRECVAEMSAECLEVERSRRELLEGRLEARSELAAAENDRSQLRQRLQAEHAAARDLRWRVQMLETADRERARAEAERAECAQVEVAFAASAVMGAELRESLHEEEHLCHGLRSRMSSQDEALSEKVKEVRGRLATVQGLQRRQDSEQPPTSPRDFAALLQRCGAPATSDSVERQLQQP